MKNRAFQAILLAFVFVMPLVFTSVVQLSDDCGQHAFFEDCSEEGQSDERESDARKDIDKLEGFVFQFKQNFTSNASSVEYFSKSKALVSVSKDVLTPPPEFI